jgi:hypothetical protein
MHPQYVNTSISKDGTIQRQTVEDSRECFVNAVSAVLINLSPELSRSKRKETIEDLEKKKEEVFKKYAMIDYEPFAIINSNGTLTFNIRGEPFIPDYDSYMRIKKVTKNNYELENIKGYGNQNNKMYWEAIIKISDKILAELQCLVDELNYFKQQSSF